MAFSISIFRQRAFWVLLFFTYSSHGKEWDSGLQQSIYNDYSIFRRSGYAVAASDNIRDFMSIEFFSMTLFAGYKMGFSNKESWGWILTNIALRELNFTLSDFGKETFKKDRPNGGGNKSFPSAHTSSAFAMAAIMSYDLDQFFPDNQNATAVKIANLVLATSVGWFRVEGGAHYPTDVIAGGLLGYALGYYGKRWIHSKFDLNFHATPNTQTATLTWKF